MTLSDARRIAVTRQLRIRFALGRGFECVITERGVAEIPGLTAGPEFNIDDEFARAAQFTVEPAAAARTGARSGRTVGREDLEALARSQPVEAGEEQ